MSRVYRGVADGPSAAHVVSIVENGETVGLLRHVVKHSPTGLAWGYSGSGPADLARSLLVDALGADGVCKGCGGSGYQRWPDENAADWTAAPVAARKGDPGASYCVECGGEGTAFTPSLYQAFKSDVVARWPQGGEWKLSQREILAWVAARSETIH